MKKVGENRCVHEAITLATNELYFYSLPNARLYLTGAIVLKWGRRIDKLIWVHSMTFDSHKSIKKKLPMADPLVSNGILIAVIRSVNPCEINRV